MNKKESNVLALRSSIELAKTQHADILGHVVRSFETVVEKGWEVTGIAFVVFSKEVVTEPDPETGEETVTSVETHSLPDFMLEDVDGPVEHTLAFAGNLFAHMSMNINDYVGDDDEDEG